MGKQTCTEKDIRLDTNDIQKSNVEQIQWEATSITTIVHVKKLLINLIGRLDCS